MIVHISYDYVLFKEGNQGIRIMTICTYNMENCATSNADLFPITTTYSISGEYDNGTFTRHLSNLII